MANYAQTLKWMYDRLPFFMRQGETAHTKSLDNIKAFLDELGQPQTKYPVIHIGGTNGKGSVSCMLASVLKEAGYRTGLYTSPHLLDFRERIRVDGKMIPQKVVTAFVERHKDFIESRGLSFFELTVGLAFFYFRKMKSDVAVVEVGLGGRLDSTNVVDPELSIITGISPDHTDLLGDTPEQIAMEKAGIIKPGKPVIVGPVAENLREILEKVAREKGSEITFAELSYPLPQTDLDGPYQDRNIPVAMEAIMKLRSRGFVIPQQAVERGFRKVKENTGLTGRWHIYSRHPYIIMDVGHNPEAFRHLVPGLRKIMAPRKTLLLGFVEGKDVEAIVRELPWDYDYVITAPSVPRAMPAEKAAVFFERTGLQTRTFPDVRQALEHLVPGLDNDDLLFIGGSTFVVADALQSLHIRRGKVVLADTARTT